MEDKDHRRKTGMPLQRVEEKSAEHVLSVVIVNVSLFKWK